MTGNFAGFQLKDSSFNTIQGGSSQGKQNNTLVGNQQNALRIIGNSANNSIIVSHSANNGATIGAALSADSIAKDSFMVFNGQLQG